MGGGNSAELSERLAADDGLSPRGRGKRLEYVTRGRRKGSIPAWAGETAVSAWSKRAVRVYPRVGGGNAASAVERAACAGLSPRGRGKRIDADFLVVRIRSIPAWAGETGG